MSRVIFINRYFFPDHSATSQILTDLTFRLSAIGHDVHVITSRQVYDDPTALLRTKEEIEGVSIHRVRTTTFGRSGLAKRSLDYLTFYLSAARALASIAEKGDIVIAKTDPPLLSILALPISRWRSAHLINWLQDLYPEVALELNVPLLSRVSWPIGRLRDHSLRQADSNVAICGSMAERLCKVGVPQDRIRVIENWADDASIRPLNADENLLRAEWQLKNKFIVGYSGNLGRAHEFETLLGSAQELRSHANIAFVVVGGGKQFDSLRARVNDLGLSHSFHFHPYQTRASLRNSLTLPDAHWISLRPEMEGLIFPSKFFGIAAAARPILAIVSSQSEMARLVRIHDCGVVVEPGDSTSLSQAILRLASEPAACDRMGSSARAMLEQHFSRDLAFERWKEVIQSGGCAQNHSIP